MAILKRPSLIVRMNRIKRNWENTCGAPWQLWFETLVPAIAPVIFSGFTFSLRDITKMRAGISYRCGVKGLLNDAFKDSPILNSAGKRWLFELTRPIERGLWYYFLADLGLTGLTNWTSAVHKLAPCDPSPTHGPSMVSGGTLVNFGIGTWGSMPWNHKMADSAGWYPGSGPWYAPAITTPGVYTFAAGGTSWVSNGNYDSVLEVAIRTTGNNFVTDTQILSLHGATPVTWILFGTYNKTLNTDEGINVWMKNNGGYIITSSGTRFSAARTS